MRMTRTWSFGSILLCAALAGCAGAPSPRAADSPEAGGEEPAAVYRDAAGTALGEPLSLAVDFAGRVYAGDGAPGRIVGWLGPDEGAVEFQKPTRQPGFYPSDIEAGGFFVYALDPMHRTLLRFDNRGAYRDILIKFDELAGGRRITPTGLDVDQHGRIVVSDTGNHQVMVFDSYLAVELVFGNYGSHAGQFDGPEGVAFTPAGGFVVTDTGNRRLQIFDAGGRFLASVPGAAPNPLVSPRRAVVNRDGAFVVADPGARRVFVFAADGTLVRSVFPANARDFRPTDVEVDASNAIYVTDAASASVLVFR